MSFSTIKPYFRLVLGTVGGLVEWQDAFNEDNIPSNKLDRGWHLIFDDASAVSHTQPCLTYDVPITLNVYFKGFNQPAKAIDTALEKLDAILKEVLKHSNRLTQPYIKNVLSVSWALEPLADSNDNVVKLAMRFNLTVMLDIE
jgi:hypothetical protein